MTNTQAFHRGTQTTWPSAMFVAPQPRLSLALTSALLAAAIPMATSLYWIAFSVNPDLIGSLLRVCVLACAVLLALIWYRAPITKAEIDLIRVFGLTAILLFIPALTAADSSHALSGWLKTLTLFSICCFVARGLRHQPTAHIFGISLLAGAFILTAFILYTYVHYVGFAIPTFKMAREFKGFENVAGVSLNSIAFDAVLSYATGLCLVRANKLLLLMGIPLAVVSSVFTGSRAPVTILAASVFVLLIVNGLRSKTLLIWLATLVIAVGALAGGAATLIFASDAALNSASEGRWHLWSVALQKFEERPILGFGYESWRDDLVSRLPGEYDLTLTLSRNLGGAYHNQYLTVLAEEGLAGLLAVALIVWLTLRSSWLLAFGCWKAVTPENLSPTKAARRQDFHISSFRTPRHGRTQSGQWLLFAAIFLLLRANFEVPGFFGYGQDPIDYLAYILLGIAISRFSVEQDCASLIAPAAEVF